MRRSALLRALSGLALALASCGDTQPGEPGPALILARDRAADAAWLEDWAGARARLAPFVVRKDAAAEDLLRAAFVELADKANPERTAAARPLIERAAERGADPAQLLWARYRVAAIDAENGLDAGAALPILRDLRALRPRDFLVTLALAAELDAADEPAAENEAQALYREVLALPAEWTVGWRMNALYKLAQSLQRQAKEDDARQLFDEFSRYEARDVKNPGTPSHEPDTLGAVRAHTPDALERPAPAPFATRFEARELAPAGAWSHALPVQLHLSADEDVGRSLAAPHEELYRFEPDPVVLGGGPAGVGLAGRGQGRETLLAGAVVDLLPFDRMNNGATKGTDDKTKAKRGDRDLDALHVVATAGGSELRLLENVGGTWTARPEALATLPPHAGAGRLLDLDFDHDGDVDLLVMGADAPRLLRNDGVDGSGSFSDASAGAALPSGDFRAMSEDVDRDDDVDLLLHERGSGTLRLLGNERGGRFSDASASLPAGLRGRWVVPADLDGDGWVDLAVFADDLALHTRTATGGWRTEVRRLALPEPPTGEPLAVDLDLDGAFDLLWPVASAPGVALLAPGFAAGGLPAKLGAPFASPRPGAARLAVADLDADRDLDLVRLDEAGAVAHFAEGKGNGFEFALHGHKDCARGVGAIVELRSGSLYRRLYYRGVPELCGFGGRAIDALRVRWPNGRVQTEFNLASGGALLVAQRPGLGGSCPFLYTWNGTTYEFVSDVLGITPLGLPMAPGMLVPPDHDEYVLVKGEQLVPRDGVYEMHFTEELREVTYLDRIRLDVVDHPADTEVFPNERFSFPPFPEAHTHVVKDPLSPLTALDQDARDWRAELAGDDQRFAIPFENLRAPYLGLATPHTLELAFDRERVRSAAKLRLFLNGWFYWTDASVNVAVARHPDFEFVPPILSVPDGNGGWKECGAIGFPAGKLKTMAVDVGALLDRDDPRIRLFSTLRIYWDSIRLAVDADDAPRVTTALEPLSARLWQRGFSRSHPLLGEHDCEWFEWDSLEPEPRWNQHPGLYTRLGETLPLVSAIDDRFVVMGAGDALTVRFDATRLPPLPEGWRRDYLVFLDGWAKDRDPNTLEALYVEPLPFHGMSGYPYGADERYPDDEEHRAYRREWNTRPATRWIAPLVPGPLPVRGRASATSAMPASSARPASTTGSVMRSPSTHTPAAPATSG